MIMLILTIHLIFAAIYTISVIGLTIAAFLRKTMPTIRMSVISSFVSVAGSGLVLVIVSPKAITHYCASMFIASLCGAAAWVAYKKRITALQPKKSALY